METNRVQVDIAIHIPEGHRLSIHAMAGLMNTNSRCIHSLGDNLFVICDDSTFDMIQSDQYNVLGIEYDGHMYEHEPVSDIHENIVLEPVDMWDEYTEWVEAAI